MEEDAKKLKAAIMGVIYYLQQEESEKVKADRNAWSRSSRESIMKNRIAVQSRSFGLRWHSK